MGEPGSQLDLAIAIGVLEAVFIGRYSIVSAYSIVVYEWLTSLDEEIEYIRQARWTSVKVAYLFCRYWTLLTVPLFIWGCMLDHALETCLRYVHVMYATLPPISISAQFILLKRAYAFSGQRRAIFAILFVGWILVGGIFIWVMALNVQLISSMFVFVDRTGCFASSDQQQKVGSHFGFWHLGLTVVSLLLFDCLNIAIILQHWYKERGTLGPIGRSFIRQGLIVYVAMTAMNLITAGALFGPAGPHSTIGSWHALILPSPMACRLVLILRRKAAPTDTQLLVQYSHMVDEALEMVPTRHSRDGAVDARNGAA